MKSSIIIPTADRPIAIQFAIQSLLAISTEQQKAEIIIVDNNSSDELSAELHAYCLTFSDRIKYVRECSPGLSAARHRGVAEAQGELLTFIDDDVEVSEGWLKAIQKGFDDLDVALIGGPSIPKFTSSIPSWFWDYIQPTPYGGWMCGWLSLLDIGKDVQNIDPNLIWGLNLSIRKSVLDSCGGFHPDLVPEHLQRWQGDGETGLTMKVRALGLRADYLQDAMLLHQCGRDRLNVEYFKKRAFFQGVCDSFTQIRKGQESVLGPLQEVRATLCRRILDMAERVWRGFKGQAIPVSLWAEEAAQVKKISNQARRDGWMFHQCEVSSDPLLLAWVRQDNYRDCHLPESSESETCK